MDLKKRVDGVAEKQDEGHELSSQTLSALEKLDKNVRNLMSTAQTLNTVTPTTAMSPSLPYTLTSSATPGTLPASTINKLRSQLSMAVLIPRYIPSSAFYNGESINSRSPQGYSIIFTRSLNYSGTTDPQFESNEPSGREGEKSFKIGIFNARSYVDPDDRRFYVVITYLGNHYRVDAKLSELSRNEIMKIAQSVYLPR